MHDLLLQFAGLGGAKIRADLQVLRLLNGVQVSARMSPRIVPSCSRARTTGKGAQSSRCEGRRHRQAQRPISWRLSDSRPPCPATTVASIQA
jgi:hypothetical protein